MKWVLFFKPIRGASSSGSSPGRRTNQGCDISIDSSGVRHGSWIIKNLLVSDEPCFIYIEPVDYPQGTGGI